MDMLSVIFASNPLCTKVKMSDVEEVGEDTKFDEKRGEGELGRSGGAWDTELIGKDGSSGSVALSGDFIPSSTSLVELESLIRTLSREERIESTIDFRKLRLLGFSPEGSSGVFALLSLYAEYGVDRDSELLA